MLPASLAISSAELGDHLAVGDQRGQVADHLLEQPLAPGQPQIGELLRAQQQAEPGRAGAAEQPHHLLGGDRGELVDHHQRRHRRPCSDADDRLQVLHDRRRRASALSSGRLSDSRLK